jgi:hypothetical protein
VGGASPTGVIASGDRIYVSLAHEDAAVLSADGSKLIGEIPLTPFTDPRSLMGGAAHCVE